MRQGGTLKVKSHYNQLASINTAINTPLSLYILSRLQVGANSTCLNCVYCFTLSADRAKLKARFLGGTIDYLMYLSQWDGNDETRICKIHIPSMCAAHYMMAHTYKAYKVK